MFPLPLPGLLKMLNLKTKEIFYFLKSTQPMTKGHRDVLGADNDFRDPSDIPVNTHVNDDTTVSPILTALDPPFDDTDPVQRSIKVEQRQSLIGFSHKGTKITKKTKPYM